MKKELILYEGKHWMLLLTPREFTLGMGFCWM
jgi:hypothetical protein